MNNLYKYFFFFISITFITSCSASNGSDPNWNWGKTDSTSAKPRYIWIDACANFPEFANSKENIRRDLEKAKDAGFTNVVVDVRPSMGDVLYKTSYVDQVKKLDVWQNGTYTFYDRTATWDYLQAFIDIGHELGLKVDAAFNTFVGGNLYPYGLGAQGLLFRDSSKKSWATVLNLSNGLTNVMDMASTNPSDNNFRGCKFLNPTNDDVQAYILNLLSDLSKYDLDGIFLDRCRYDDLLADFSDFTKSKFEAYIGKKINFPSDILIPGTSSLPSIQPTYFKEWLTFRAQTIHDFINKAVKRIHSVNDTIKVGVYVGGWYSTYYEMGVNWASPKYNTNYYYPEWANTDYAATGYADLLDFMLIGAYAPADQIYGTTEWTMQGFCIQAKKLLCNDVEFAGGPDVGNPSGFENGGQDTVVKNSVDACINAADGYFIFDMVHVRKYNYWDALKQGIDNYLNSLSNISVDSRPLRSSNLQNIPK